MSAEPNASERQSLLVCVAVGMVRQYQRWLSPLLGNHCRFYPTCSEYTVRAIRKYGVVAGIARGAWRICRCHPFHPGGVDLP